MLQWSKQVFKIFGTPPGPESLRLRSPLDLIILLQHREGWVANPPRIAGCMAAAHVTLVLAEGHV